MVATVRNTLPDDNKSQLCAETTMASSVDAVSTSRGMPGADAVRLRVSIGGSFVQVRFLNQIF